MPQDRNPVPPDPAKLAEARNFLDRLVQGRLPGNHVVPEGQEVLAPLRRRRERVQRRDPVTTVALDPDTRAVREDVAAAMRRIRGTVATLRAMRAGDWSAPGHDPSAPAAGMDPRDAGRLLLDGLHRKGRDKIAYALFARKGRMDELLDAWDESWDIEKTVGLLVDMSMAVRGPRARQGDQPGARGELMSPVLMASRGAHHEVDRQSDWYRNLPENTPAYAGASASTAVLLLMLEDMDVPLPQVEALMNALVRYWDGPIRKASGMYHTAAEVWAAYNEHLESRLRLQWATNRQRIEDAARARLAAQSVPPDPPGAPGRPIPPADPYIVSTRF